MIRYLAFLTIALLLTASCSGGSESGTDEVAASPPTTMVTPPAPTPTGELATTIAMVTPSPVPTQLAPGAQMPTSGPPIAATPKRPAKGGGSRPEDKYACVVTPNGYCIFTGMPHQTGLDPNNGKIVDRSGVALFSINEAVAVNSSGTVLQAKGTPAFDGDELIKHSKEGMNHDEDAFHRVMAIMFPIRNALMYDIATITQKRWESLVSELEIRAIKDKTFTGGPTPRDNYYGRQGIFNLAKDPKGKDIHHDVMKFLEESGLYLLCHVTSNEFNTILQETHPENHDPCQDAGITSKIPF